MKYDVQMQRVYAAAQATDGARVLVDRLWPRGRKKEELALTEWYKDASPSAALRHAWHNTDIDDEEFKKNYSSELDNNSDSLLPLMRYARAGRLTLLTASQNPQHSHLPILRDALCSALYKDDIDADGNELSSPVCYRNSDNSNK